MANKFGVFSGVVAVVAAGEMRTVSAKHKGATSKSKNDRISNVKGIGSTPDESRDDPDLPGREDDGKECMMTVTHYGCRNQVIACLRTRKKNGSRRNVAVDVNRYYHIPTIDLLPITVAVGSKCIFLATENPKEVYYFNENKKNSWRNHKNVYGGMVCNNPKTKNGNRTNGWGEWKISLCRKSPGACSDWLSSSSCPKIDAQIENGRADSASGEGVLVKCNTNDNGIAQMTCGNSSNGKAEV